MTDDKRIIEVTLVCIRALSRNGKAITLNNIYILYSKFLEFRFDNKSIHDLDESEVISLLSLIARWNHKVKKLRLVVDNTKCQKT